MSADLRFLINSDTKKPPERPCGTVYTASGFSSAGEEGFIEECVQGDDQSAIAPDLVRGWLWGYKVRVVISRFFESIYFLLLAYQKDSSNSKRFLYSSKMINYCVYSWGSVTSILLT